jgi:hypothetical protein
MIFKISLFCFLITTFTASANDGQQIADEVLKQYSKVKTFEADISVFIDISYLNAPEKVGKIYFQSPNETKVDIEGFSMLPKQGTGNFIGEILKMKSTVISLGKQIVNGKELTHLKIIPNDSKDVVLVDMFVDEAKNVVKKADITTKDNGTFYINLEYDLFDSFFLPTLVNIEFVVPNFKMPKAFVGPRDKNKVDKLNEDGETTRGKVLIKYWNYIVNKKIDKKIFKK